MKDFFKTDEAMIDLMIVVGVLLFIYITKNITPISPDAILSGQTTEGLLSFFGAKINVGVFQGLLLSLGNALGLLAVIFLAGFFLLTIRISEIKKADNKKYAPIKEESNVTVMTIKWEVVLDHVNSENPAEWKLAILEADNMLDEILDSEGYQGETLGEKLKAMSPGTINSYDALWEAHKMRNLIAHEASTMELTKKMARDTVNKFEMAFKELGHI